MILGQAAAERTAARADQLGRNRRLERLLNARVSSTPIHVPAATLALDAGDPKGAFEPEALHTVHGCVDQRR